MIRILKCDTTVWRPSMSSHNYNIQGCVSWLCTELCAASYDIEEYRRGFYSPTAGLGRLGLTLLSLGQCCPHSDVKGSSQAVIPWSSPVGARSCSEDVAALQGGWADATASYCDAPMTGLPALTWELNPWCTSLAFLRCTVIVSTVPSTYMHHP